MVVLPADHYIGNVSRFRGALKSAVEAAGTGENIVTLGITTHRPETGYGYICRGEMVDTVAGNPVHRVRRFHEKPDNATAVNFLAEGNYLWNSGMFIWCKPSGIRGSNMCYRQKEIYGDNSAEQGKCCECWCLPMLASRSVWPRLLSI